MPCRGASTLRFGASCLKNTADIAADPCFICGGTAFGRPTPHYKRCTACGHQSLLAGVAAAVAANSNDAAATALREGIVNDRLDDVAFDKRNGLDRFKQAVLRRATRSKALLVDIGSASGRFLQQNRAAFDQAVGIEVTPACVAFARQLGLRIETDLAEVREPPTVVTFWHSLEHVPAEVIVAMLAQLQAQATPELVLLISVPNAASLQLAALKTGFAYYDIPHHLHQFSPESLDTLLGNYGFVRGRDFPSLSYASFGWLQGLLNLCNARHDYLYYRRKRGWDFGLSPFHRARLDAYNMALAGLFLAPAAALTLHDLVLHRRAGVLTVSYHPHAVVA